jgi:hypothetical protein
MKFLMNGTPIKMRDLRLAESSNTAAMELMAKYAANPDDSSMPVEQAMALLDDMDMAQFYEAFTEFAKATIPLRKGRTS